MVAKDGNPKIKRPMIWVCVAFMSGVLAGVYSSRRGVFVLALVVLSVLFAIGAAVWIIKKNAYIAAVCVISMTVAFLYSYNVYSLRFAMADISASESIVSARVLDISKTDEDTVRYELDDVYINGDKIKSGMMLSVENGELVVGDSITFTANVTKPRQARNSKVFDYREYLANKGIYYTAYISTEDIIERQNVKLNLFSGVRYAINSFKHTTAEKYGKYLSSNAKGIVNAITLGDDMYIDSLHYDVYRKSGTAHVLAISGLHVGFAAAFAGLITKKLKKYGRAYTFVNTAFVWLYIIISGCNVSAVRAGLFYTIYAIGSYAGQRSNITNTACITALIMLLRNPMVLFAASFQLSFSAILSIGILQNKLTLFIRNKLNFIPEKAVKTFSAAVCATVGVMLPIAYHFNTLSLISVFLNLIIIPLFAYIVGFAFVVMVAVTLNIGFAAKLASAIVNGLVFISDSLLNTALKLKFASITVASPNVLTIICGILILWAFSVEKPLRMNKMATVIISSSLIAANALLPHIGVKNYKVSFIDVGQAECSLIVTPTDKTVMIDAGTSYGTDGTAEYTVVPYLLKHGNRKIDYLVVSHMHSDHMGEIDDILGLIKVENIVYFAPDESDAANDLLSAAENYGVNLINMYYNRSVYVDKKTKLNRLSTYFDEDDTNDRSLIIDVECSNRHLIYSGDASGDVLDRAEYPDDIFLYKVAHHGSKTSYSDVIMHNLPQFSIICTKEGNVYKLPNEETLEKYKEYSTVLRTSSSGEISFSFNDEKYKLYEYFG